MESAPVFDTMAAFPAYVPVHPTGRTSHAVKAPQSAEFAFENIEALVAYSDKSTWVGEAAYGLAA